MAYKLIEEDYVSFETAKLLQAKGYEQFDFHKSMYDINGNVWWGALPAGLGYERPTLQRAMKWLRDVHKIGVFPTTYSIMRGDDVAHVYDAVIINLTDYTLMTENLELEKDSYEEAAEAGIKYCLENLI